MSDLLLRVLRGGETPRRPIWIMRQAGRYLPEYRALRDRYGFVELMRNPELAAQVTLLPLERFTLDAAIVFADIMSPIGSLGLGFRFEPGPVMERPLRDKRDIQALPEPAPEEIAPEVIETLRLVRHEMGNRAALIGFVGAPLSLAAYLVEGGGSKDFARLRALAVTEPRVFGELLGRLTRLAAGFIREQVRAGAQVIQVFDSWAGLFPEGEWTRLVRPHLVDLLEEAERSGVPRIVFCHAAPHLAMSYAGLPSEALSLDWRSDLGEMRRRLGPAKVLQGNLDPAVLLGGVEVTRRETRRLLRAVPARGHVVNLGHGILPETPIESVEAMIEAVHAEAAETVG